MKAMKGILTRGGALYLDSYRVKAPSTGRVYQIDANNWGCACYSCEDVAKGESRQAAIEVHREHVKLEHAA
jgi:hypothetical protein